MPDDEIPDMNLDDPLTWKESGNDYFRKGQYEDAIKCYAHAIQIKPDFIDAWNNMGFALLKTGKIDEAKECNAKVKKIKEEQKSQVVKTPAPIVPIKTQGQSVSIDPPIDIPPIVNKSNIRTPKDIPLIEGEVPIWFGQMSWAANWVLLLLAVIFLFTIIGIILSFILVLIAWINVSTSEYFISNKRIYFKYGLIRRVANDLKLEWVTNTSIAQGFVGRILNYGNVLIATPGTSTGTSMFWGPSDPMKIKGIIEKQIVNYKKTEQINQSLRTLTDEFQMGRLDENRYIAVKNQYEMELKKYSN